MSLTQTNKIIKDIKEGKIANVYFLCGAEPYFIDKISYYIECNLLSEDQKKFDQMVVYGRDITVEHLIVRAKTYPMMADKNVIIVKEAGELSRNIGKLKSYFENIQPQTVLVLNYKYKDLPQPTLFKKLLNKNGVIFQTKKIYENQMPAFIESVVREKKYKIQPKSVQMLIEFLGTDLGRVVNELQKLFGLLSKDIEITPEHIEKYIGISKDFNIFELQKVIGRKEIKKCYQIIQYFARNPKNNPLQVTLTILHNYFTNLLLYHSLKDRSRENVAKKLKINPFFVADFAQASVLYSMRKTTQILDYLLVADQMNKGLGRANTSDEDVQKELLFKILN